MARKSLSSLKYALEFTSYSLKTISSCYYFPFSETNLTNFSTFSPFIFHNWGLKVNEVPVSSNFFNTRRYAQSGNRISRRKKYSFKNSHEDSVISLLQEILCCDVEQAQKIYFSNESYFNSKDHVKEEVLAKCIYCENVGIPKEFISNNPWVLKMSDNEIGRKIKLLEKWKFKSLVSNLSLMELPLAKLTAITHKITLESSTYSCLENSNRISYLALKLERNEEDISRLVMKHEFLIKMKFSKLKSTLEILISNGIDPKYIFLDIWVVRYSLNEIQKRLKLMKSALELDELRPWMLHCRNESFQRTITLRDENRNAREPFENDEDYLCHRLNISPEEVLELYQRHPPLRCVQTTKLKDILDFLFLEGFTSIDVCRFPRILCHSLLTIKERISHMKSLGYRPQSLAVCCKTKKKFQLLINKLDSRQSQPSKLQ